VSSCITSINTICLLSFSLYAQFQNITKTETAINFPWDWTEDLSRVNRDSFARLISLLFLAEMILQLRFIITDMTMWLPNKEINGFSHHWSYQTFIMHLIWLLVNRWLKLLLTNGFMIYQHSTSTKTTFLAQASYRTEKHVSQYHQATWLSWHYTSLDSNSSADANTTGFCLFIEWKL